MYLEKLEVQGLKSFANRNILKFPGFLGENKRGLTAVVGPNGSGKSNVADAIRWALGEQSMKTLRGKRAEDIIFSGTEKKGKLGMAEVSLFLNNSGAKVKKEALLEKAEKANEQAENEKLKFKNDNEDNNEKLKVKKEKKDKVKEFSLSPMDFSEIVITRRLYRNGDSEYIINGSRVRLSDIQMFLAQAKFGQKTYSVIGQGTVEGFLNTTMSERKEFFDEATGVKQFQIKRDESLNKLRNSYENLIQVQMLITEIEPRLKSLTRQVNRLNKRGELEKELKKIQLKYYSKFWHKNNDKFKIFNEKLLSLEAEKREKDKKHENLNKQMNELEKKSGVSDEFAEMQNQIFKVQSEKDDLNSKFARIEAQLEMNLESQGKFDLSFLTGKITELKKEKEKIKEEIASLQNNLEAHKKKHEDFDFQLDSINNEIKAFNEKLITFSQTNDNQAVDLDQENVEIKKALKKIELIKKEEDILKLRILIEELELFLQNLMKRTKDEGAKEPKAAQELKDIQNELQKKAEIKEGFLGKYNDNNLRMSAISERIKLLEEKLQGTQDEQKKIENKLEENSGEVDLSEIEEKKSKVQQELDVVNDKLKILQDKFSSINKKEKEKKERLFSLQKELQVSQNELNFLNNQLNDVKVNSARYETKLEDLEIEIRDEIHDLKIVKDEKPLEELDMEKTKKSIIEIKRQLDLIGGIDPQVEDEYKKTKERFDFLSGQVEDFNATVKTMEKIIKDLDLAIKDKFDQEFVLIQKNFEKYFKILFNGGNAKLIKVMEDVEAKKNKILKENSLTDLEPGEKKEKFKAGEMQMADLKKVKFLQKHNATGLQGVEIKACPPGKKIASIAMLSGGERALTAIALICAIISANPSPFVVLDEVDAALDEANSERLAKILDELSHKTQFITITHNRAIMRRANILYGVTMGDDGVSRLLSVKLDEAVKTASR